MKILVLQHMLRIMHLRNHTHDLKKIPIPYVKHEYLRGYQLGVVSNDNLVRSNLEDLIQKWREHNEIQVSELVQRLKH